MKPVHLLTFLWCASCCGAWAADDKIDPRQVLDEALILAKQGKYEEALKKHLWIHENALKHRPSFSGVRLSFALEDWMDLAKKYPKAKVALVAIRDKNNETIKVGKGSHELFQDVSAINRRLEEPAKTVALFKVVHAKFPDLARRCYPVAEKDLVAQREYAICLHYLPDPIARFDEIRTMRDDLLKFAKDENDPSLKKFADDFFVKDTCCLIEILVGASRKKVAERVRERALAVYDVPAIREAIEKAIERQNKQGGEKK